jgi:Concanavalin A-like lectin/glucanases superfamily
VRLLLACLLAAVGALYIAQPSSAAAQPLRTAMIDHGELDGPDADLALTRARAAGASAFRLMLEWYRVAPVERPEGFDAANPNSPGYDWSSFDRKIRMIAAHGLEPIVVLHYPPVWAGGGFTPVPDPVETGKFAHAAAEHYNGASGVPRVRYWMIWNEPNVELDFSPQFDAENRPVSPAAYRTVLNAAADGIHAARSDNLVIAGALSPFGVDTRDYLRTMPPMVFMRELLCMSDGKPPQPTCQEQAHFDVWAHHPYTRGGPTHKAKVRDDVSLGNLDEMSTMLGAATRAGHIMSARPVQFWATEFSWDTKPPDPLAVPLRLQARWVSEALYRMWKLGVGLVAWLQIRDAPYPEKGEQSGLWYYGGPRLACDDAKTPTLTSFHFPFVAYTGKKKRLTVWGRTPTSRPGLVTIQQLTPKGWRDIGKVHATAGGIFSGRVPALPPRTRGRFSEPLPARRNFSLGVFCGGPRHYWRLGDRSGVTARDEVGTGAATYEGGVGLGAPGAPTGVTDPSVTLDGSGRVSLGWQWSPRTVELWLKTTDPGPGAAFSNRNDISHYVFLGTSGDGRLLAFDTRPLTSEARIDDGRWHYVVYTYDGTVGRLYLDGSIIASESYERILGGAEASIGYDASLQSSFRGSVDEVAIYDTALSEAQVREHYASRLPRSAGSKKIAGRYVRARFGSAASQPFSLVRAPDHPYDPFGYPGFDDG